MLDPDNCVPDEEVLKRGDAFFMQYPRNSFIWGLGTRTVLLAVGAFSKLFTCGLHTTCVLNGSTFFSALDRAQAENRGVITAMNHISVLDDPLVWGGTLPISFFFQPGKIRFTLGAQDVVFRNRAESLFFSLGQVLPVQRFGRGPDQPALDCAIGLVSKHRWVHVYPEGFVHQPYSPYQHTLRYFHWGVARLILESGPKQPIVIPVYGQGLDDVFPEDLPKRVVGYGFGSPIMYAFGEPLSEEKIGELRVRWQQLKSALRTAPQSCEAEIKTAIQQLRSETANLVREGVLQTKHDYFGLSPTDMDTKLNSPEFWRTQTIVKIRGKSVAEKTPQITPKQ